MQGEETVEHITVVDLSKMVWEWADIGTTGIQICMVPSDVIGTFRFRVKPCGGTGKHGCDSCGNGKCPECV